MSETAGSSNLGCSGGSASLPRTERQGFSGSPTLQSCSVVAHESRGCSLYELTLASPNVAPRVMPGQFVHLALVEQESHLLRRPLSVYKANASAGTITLLYQVVGEGTRHLSQTRLGAEVSILGPIGRGWNPPANASRCLLIGGGVGAAPLYMLTAELAQRGVALDVILGAATRDHLVCEGSFAELLATEQLYLATDDGSKGFRGFTTQLAAQLLERLSYDYIATCGPEPMQKAVARLARSVGAPCEVSLERRMACGLGACLSCVVDTVSGKQRACVDGPVFDAEEVCW